MMPISGLEFISPAFWMVLGMGPVAAAVLGFVVGKRAEQPRRAAIDMPATEEARRVAA
jgi:hypothetical protein